MAAAKVPSIMDYWICISCLCIPVYFAIGRLVFFDSWQDVRECLYYLIKPDIVSLLQGERVEDFYAELKLLLFLITCAAAVTGIHRLFGESLRALFQGLGLI